MKRLFAEYTLSTCVIAVVEIDLSDSSKVYDVVAYPNPTPGLRLRTMPSAEPLLLCHAVDQANALQCADSIASAIRKASP